MRTSTLKTRLTGLIAMVFLVSGWAQADYVMHGRVSYDAGNTLVKGAEEADWSNASINTLILTNDTLWVDSGGTAEVEFPGGNFLRMADASKVEVQSVSPTLSLRGWTGSFYVQRIQRSTGDVVLDTPAGSIRVAADTNLRVDILEDGATAITVRWGVATVRALSGHESDITAGRRVWVEPGMLPSEAVRFSSSNDDAFDHWNRERAEWLAQGPGETPVPVSDKAIGVSDLNRYGEWVTVDNRSYWRPTVVTEYVPYRHGRWSYTSGVGHVWVGMYPFSYVTTHHGYWDYRPNYGWLWSYHDTWSPAWVATVRYGDYFVWSPVNQYHRPSMVTESAYFNIGGVQFSYHASSYAPSNYLYWGPSRIYPTYGSNFQNAYNSGNVTNINIWNINVSGNNNHVRVPYDREFAQMTRNYNPSRTIRGTVSSPTDRGRSAFNRVSALESRIARDTFSVRGRETSGNVRTAINSSRAAQGRTVRMQEETPSYLRDIRSGRTVNAEEVRASVRDRQAIPAPRGGSVRSEAGASQERGATVRDGRSTPAGQDRLTRAPENDRGAGSSVRSGVTERGSVPSRGTATERSSAPSSNTGRETVDRGSVRQQPSVTDRSSTPGRSAAPSRSAAPERSTVRQQPSVTDRSGSASENRGSSVRQTPSQAQPRATTPERTAPRERVQATGPTSRGNTASSAPSRTSTSRSSVRSQDERPRATTPSRSTAAPRATSPSRSTERVAPQSQPSRSQPQAQNRSSSSVRSTPTPSTPRSQATATPQRSAPSATYRGSSVGRPDMSRSNSAPRATSPSTGRPNVSAPRAQSQRSAPSASVRQPSAQRSAPSSNRSSITPRSVGNNRPSISSRSSSAPSRSSSISSRSSSRSSASISPRSSGGAPSRGGR